MDSLGSKQKQKAKYSMEEKRQICTSSFPRQQNGEMRQTDTVLQIEAYEDKIKVGRRRQKRS